MTGTRYYTFAGATVAVRTVTDTEAGRVVNLAFLFGDEQGSTSVMMPAHVGASGAVAPATLADASAATRTAYTPYGALRGGDNQAVDRGWLGQVEDRVDGAAGTGLTYLNARYYDPATMRFISPDPLMNPADPKTLDPYRYADNNPVVFTDASGLTPTCWGTNSLSVNACLAKYESLNAPTQAQKNRAKYFLEAVSDGIRQKSGRRTQPSVRGVLTGKSDYSILTGAAAEAEYRGQRDARRVRQGAAQNTFDNVTGTSSLEVDSAMNAIWQDGATVYTGGPACGKLMECFVGANFSFGYITLGHTVLADRGEGDSIGNAKQAHEYAHVLDVEYWGAAQFYVKYGLDAVLAQANDPSGKFWTGWHDENPDEWRGLAAEDAFNQGRGLVYFDPGDVRAARVCQAFLGVACQAPAQSFAPAVLDGWSGAPERSFA